MKQIKFKNFSRFFQYQEINQNVKKYCTDLTQLADRGYLNCEYCREELLNKIFVSLCKKTKSNVMLIGEPGVGKTALIENLAYKIAKKDVPIPLVNKKILSLNIHKLLSGAKYRGDLEERLEIIISEIQKSKSIILFIDEIHNIIKNNPYKNSDLDIGNILKPFLSRGNFQCIGATTTKEYSLIAEDTAFVRRFQNIYIEEFSKEETFLLLKTLKDDYENFHSVKLTDEIFLYSIWFCNNFILGKKMPDKVLDCIDSLCSNISILKNKKTTNNIERLKNEIIKLKDEQTRNLNDFNIDKAILLKKEITKKEKILNRKLLNFSFIKRKVLISKNDLVKHFISSTGLNFIKLINKENLSQFLKKIKSKVLSQEQAITNVIKHINIFLNDFYEEKGLGTIFFIGPKGVGKTKLVKILNNEMFTKNVKLIQIDCSIYSKENEEDLKDIFLNNNFTTFGLLHFYNFNNNNLFITNFINKFLFEDKNNEKKKKYIKAILTIFEMDINFDKENSNIGFKKNNIISEKEYFNLCNHFQWSQESLFFKKISEFFDIDFLMNIDRFCIFNILETKTILKIFNQNLSISLKKMEKFYNIHISFEKDINNFFEKDSLYLKEKNASYIDVIIKNQICKPLEDFIIYNNIQNSYKNIKIIYKNKSFIFNVTKTNKQDTKLLCLL